MPQDPIAQVLTPDKTTQVPGQELHKPGENQAVQEQVQPNYPAWPTSKPGPRTTPSPIGMKPINAIRREQVAEIGYVIGDVAGKTAVLVDDIIGTAGTLKAAARAVHDAGAKRVYAAATHGNFSGNAWENLAAADLEQIVVTDTIPLPPGAPDNVRVLPCADLLTNSIRQIFTDGSVSDVFDGENQLF